MNISVNITPNIPKPNPNPILSAFLLYVRCNIVPHLLFVEAGHKSAGIAFTGYICIVAGMKVCVELIIRLIPGIA